MRRKTSVTDELLDAFVNRPLAAVVVKAVAPTPVTPNHLTLAAATAGTVAGVAFALPSAGARLLGAAAVLLFMILDCSDGQLARVRGGGSVLGRIADGFADYWVAIAVHAGILTGLCRAAPLELLGRTLSPFDLFLLVLAAGVTMAVNAGRFDHHKQRYLAHTDAAREPETPETYLAVARATRSPVVRLGLETFARYVRAQQGPAYLARLAEARQTASDPRRAASFARDNGPLVRLWSLTGPTTQVGAIGLAALFSTVSPGAFVDYCVATIVGVNLYCVAVWLYQGLLQGTAGALPISRSR
jgi:hypothetical protein